MDINQFWEKVSNLNIISENNCWTTCNGGFCCSNNHPDFDFKFIPQNGTTIIYMNKEYEYLKNINAFLNFPVSKISIDFGGPNPLIIYYQKCNLLGNCNGKIIKPLLCKLYPFIPIYKENDEISLIESSVFDITFNVLNIKSPCTILEKKKFYTNFYKENSQVKSLLLNPSIQLYAYAALSFANSMKNKLVKNKQLVSLNGQKFWKQWEIEHLSGNLIDINSVKAEILKSYQYLVSKYGNFEY
jgi:hypothetical protein